MKLNKRVIYIGMIFIITIVTRFVGLDRVPPHLSNDEISIAFDSYSIGTNLRDEYGTKLPLSFRSHNTYKAPLSIYLSVPFNKLIGNSDFSARLPSVIFGSLSVLIIGLIAFELTQNINIGILSSLILSLTPAHIHASRMIQETNIALFFVLLGTWFILRFREYKENINWIAGFVCFALSMFAYHTEWGFTPLWMVCLFLIYFKKLPLRKIVVMVVTFGLLISPLIINYLQNLSTGARANTELITRDPGVNAVLQNGSISTINQGGYVFTRVVQNYSNYLSLNHLFFSGMKLLPDTDPFQVGLFLSPLIIMFFIGMLFQKEFIKGNSKILLYLLALSIIIPAFTLGEVSNYRILLIIFPVTIITALGLWKFFTGKNHILLKLSYIAICIVSILYFVSIYYFYYPFQNGENFQYGYKQAALYLKAETGKYNKVIIDPRFGENMTLSGVPRLYLPYYMNIDPRLVQNREEIGFVTLIGNIEIRNIDWKNEIVVMDVIYIVPTNNSPEDTKLKLVKEIFLPNGKSEFRLFKIL